MQVFKQLGAVALLGAVIAACGGNTPTQAPAATQSGGGGGDGATQAPAATADNGGNGNNGGTIGFQNGKITFTIDGTIKTSGELGFIPQASLFGGAQGSTLSFGQSDSGGTDASLVSVVQAADGTVLVSYVGPDGQVPAATCTTTDLKIEATSGSGKFDCRSDISITASGAAVGGSTIKGEFTAHA
jgi:hypothetical protein